MRGVSGSTELRPERARLVDVAIEHRVGKALRWQATLFNREEADILREPDIYPRLVDTVIFDPPDPGRYRNSLSGSSRGIELLVNRLSTTGLAGWAAYSYARTTYTDADRDETFWADFDQRHTLNIFGVYRFSTRTSVGATFRAGSNFRFPHICAGAMTACSSRANAVRSDFPHTRVSTSVRIAASSRSAAPDTLLSKWRTC